MRRFFLMVQRDSATKVAKELREDDAKAAHEAGGDVFFMDDDGVMQPVPRPEEAPKKGKK